MNNIAQVDELWDATVSPSVGRPYLQTNRFLEAVIPTVPAKVRNPAKPLEIDFLGKKIVWIPDGNRPFPAPVLSALEQLISFSSLSEGWDSYGGHPLGQGAVGTVLSLIFLGHEKGAVPRLHPLSDGGVGLSWGCDGRELEVQVAADGTLEALYSDDEDTLAEVELTPGSTMANVIPLVGKFFERR